MTLASSMPSMRRMFVSAGVAGPVTSTGMIMSPAAFWFSIAVTVMLPPSSTMSIGSDVIVSIAGSASTIAMYSTESLAPLARSSAVTVIVAGPPATPRPGVRVSIVPLALAMRTSASLESAE